MRANKTSEDSLRQLQAGDFVNHINNSNECYKIIFVLEKSAWGIRQSDGEECMLLIENLVPCCEAVFRPINLRE